LSRRFPDRGFFAPLILVSPSISGWYQLNMAENPVQRRLAAILAGDVVGYSRLMGQDEAGTLAALKARRKEVLRPLVAKYQGRIFKFTGDGVLVEFPSPVNAVQCAVDLQHGMAAANDGLSDDRRITLRIGVNLGDVMVEGNDLYGDGVNIAARLEALAEEGGILVSGTAYDHIKTNIKVKFVDLGIQSLKNIAEPVRVYRVSQTILITQSKGAMDRPSVAILPFTNMSGDPEQQYFSDGITEDIITELSRFRELIVISRTSSFAFRAQAAPIAELARKLGAQYVVEGSIRKSGKRVRITAQLIDANGDKHIWAEHYDRELEDIFQVQDDVVHRITGTLVGRLEHERQERANRHSGNELRAYDIYLRAREHFFQWSMDDNRKAAELLETAIKIEPDYAAALALLSEVYHRDWHNGWSVDPEQDLSNSYRMAARAVELDDGDSRTHTSMGWVYLFTNELDRAKHHLDTALRLNPNDTRVLVYCSRHAVFDGKPEQGVEMIERALQLNPFGKYHWYFGLAKFAARRYDEAIELLRNVRDPSSAVVALLAASFAQLNRMDEARLALNRFRELANRTPVMQKLCDPADWRKYFVVRWPFRDKADLEHLLAGLRKAGVPIDGRHVNQT
jgi:TolB-like protein/class 3 adenylate cyclase/cytochrome c-type biogenesis protein CcmH/NrfG